MLFTEFRVKENPPILLLHGMMQDWYSEYELLKPLEEYYRLIVPAQDGFYEGSDDFTSFADQARQILRNILIKIILGRFMEHMVHLKVDLCSQNCLPEIE